ncbi:DMT family transporter [Variovorax sp. PCZ-1]|uniref:DMT family transporter n=1 Tax=Variovorax sp. PCZ-1 TaxID=2835533 RepID=UPI001BCF3915|nr:DMT family transporter [Variovorax sp. PCZ-1]MBS7807381.1 DMT family transporter [Variovorax sp. PCZ-1]
MTAPQAFPRLVSIGILLLLGLVFASNHIAARFAFDHGTGLVTAVLVRSGITALILLGVVLWLKAPLQLAAYQVPKRWVWALGALIALQSLLLYSAVARIPVALALLVFNLFPALFTLLNWLLGGPRPSARTAGLIALIITGLALALDLPGQLAKPGAGSATFWAGVGFGFGAASVFAVALRVTEFKLKALTGAVRSFWTMGLVTLMLGALSMIVLAGGAGEGAGQWLSRSLHWPSDWIGWAGLAGLTLCYGSAFSFFFALMPRLDMARNAPASNIEPVAALILGWSLLGQSMSVMQLVGAATVVLGIVLLALSSSK